MPYVHAVVEELKTRKEECGEVETLYIGGGTPSQLTTEALLYLFDGIQEHVTLLPTAEITLDRTGACREDLRVYGQPAGPLRLLPGGLRIYDGVDV